MWFSLFALLAVVMTFVVGYGKYLDRRHDTMMREYRAYLRR